MSAVDRRDVVRVIDAHRRMGGRLTRVVGSVDAAGAGTAFPLADLAPFVLVAEDRAACEALLLAYDRARERFGREDHP